MMRLALTIALVSALAACSSESFKSLQQNLFVSNPGEAALKTGLKQYEDGAYAASARSLGSAIEQGLNDPDRASAHKHLAFIHCTSNRERPCREEFRKALAADPAMELAPAEVGHPIWGPVFRSVKAGR